MGCCVGGVREVEGRSRLKVRKRKLITEPRPHEAAAHRRPGQGSRRTTVFCVTFFSFFSCFFFFLGFCFCSLKFFGEKKTPYALRIYLKPERYFYKRSPPGTKWSGSLSPQTAVCCQGPLIVSSVGMQFIVVFLLCDTWLDSPPHTQRKKKCSFICTSGLDLNVVSTLLFSALTFFLFCSIIHHASSRQKFCVIVSGWCLNSNKWKRWNKQGK